MSLGSSGAVALVAVRGLSGGLGRQVPPHIRFVGEDDYAAVVRLARPLLVKGQDVVDGREKRVWRHELDHHLLTQMRRELQPDLAPTRLEKELGGLSRPRDAHLNIVSRKGTLEQVEAKARSKVDEAHDDVGHIFRGERGRSCTEPLS
jgi:hypothetical protein